MSNGVCWQGIRAAAILVMCSLAGEGLALQAPAPDAHVNEVASDPIKCSWKTDNSAVQVGEQFKLTLTCGVIETGRVTVIPKMEPLEPSALQIAPFEMISGTRQKDIQAPPWRYFQYEYTLRLIGQDFFGQDVDIPALTVTYNVQSDVAGASEGRDQMYILPALPLRIMSLVPKKANDIRDATHDSFGAAEARLFRSTAEFVTAAILFAFSALMLAFAIAHVFRQRRTRSPMLARTVSPTAVMGACLTEIGKLKSEVAREGWTPERTGSVLTILRIGSAVAMGRPVAQASLDAAATVREGQLALRKGIRDQNRMVVSAPTTSDTIERYRRHSNGQTPNGRTRAMIDDLSKSLLTFSAVRYGRNGNVDGASLNRALESSRMALQRLRVTTLWPMRAVGSLSQSAATVRSLLWTR